MPPHLSLATLRKCRQQWRLRLISRQRAGSGRGCFCLSLIASAVLLTPHSSLLTPPHSSSSVLLTPHSSSLRLICPPHSSLLLTTRFCPLLTVPHYYSSSPSPSAYTSLISPPPHSSLPSTLHWYHNEGCRRKAVLLHTAFHTPHRYANKEQKKGKCAIQDAIKHVCDPLSEPLQWVLQRGMQERYCSLRTNDWTGMAGRLRMGGCEYRQRIWKSYFCFIKTVIHTNGCDECPPAQGQLRSMQKPSRAIALYESSCRS